MARGIRRVRPVSLRGAADAPSEVQLTNCLVDCKGPFVPSCRHRVHALGHVAVDDGQQHVDIAAASAPQGIGR